MTSIDKTSCIYAAQHEAEQQCSPQSGVFKINSHCYLLAPPPTLIDTFRLKNPHLRKFTRYPSSNHRNQARLDFILVSSALNASFPVCCTDIDTSNQFSDHHPATMQIKTPPIPTIAFSHTPSPIFRRLIQDELASFTKQLKHLSSWVYAILPLFNTLSVKTIHDITDLILMDVTTVFHNTTLLPAHKTTPTEKHFYKLFDPPPPTDPSFSSTMDRLQALQRQWHEECRSHKGNHLHKSPASGTSIKRSLDNVLQPQPQGLMSLINPEAQLPSITSPKQISSQFCTTISSLGGPENFSPPTATLHSLLSSLPQCLPSTQHQPLPSISDQFFEDALKKAKPTKRGGSDNSNLYIISICPEPIRHWFLQKANKHLHAPPPPSLAPVSTFLLYKKRQPPSRLKLQTHLTPQHNL